MHQARPAAGLLDLISNPIPVGGGFHRYLRSWLAFIQCCSNRSRPVLHAILSQLSGVGLLVLHPRVMLVTIKGNIFFHARLLSFSSPAPTYTAVRSRAFIFSFRPEQADALSPRSLAPPRNPCGGGNLSGYVAPHFRFSPRALSLLRAP